MRNTVAKPQENIRSESTRYVVWICALFYALIWGRAVNDVFFYVFTVVSVLLIALSSVKNDMLFLLFLLPFATVLKQNADGTSVFTVLAFLVTIKMVLGKGRIRGGVLLGILVFALYNLLFSGLGQLATIITMVSGMLMLYYLQDQDIDAGAAVSAFATGISLAAVLALCRKELPLVRALVVSDRLKLDANSYIDRFSGLHGNPNYYTMDVIVALAAIVVLMYQNKTQGKGAPIFLVALSVFGMMSLSKSFLLAWILLALCWIWLALRRGAGNTVRMLFVLLIGAAITYFFAFDYINSFVFRFTSDGTETLDAMTTGRITLWSAYLDALRSNVKVFLFGNGLNTILETVSKGTHNTYLESVFYLGIVGTIVLLANVRNAMAKVQVKGALWILALVLLVRMFAIGILTYNNLWFYLAILLLLARSHSEGRLKGYDYEKD